MAKHIIGLAGEIASGKDTVAKYLRESYGAKQVGFSDSLRQILGILNLSETRDNLTALSLALRTTFGQDLLSKVVAKSAEESDKSLVIIDGVRRQPDVEILGNDNFTLLYVEAALETRYQRIVGRHENADDAKSFEEFLLDHQKETEVTIPPLKTFAKAVIHNEGTYEELLQEVDSIMEKLGITKEL